MKTPRTLDYWILRTCERLSLPQEEFDSYAYPEQLRLLAFTTLREMEHLASDQ